LREAAALEKALQKAASSIIGEITGANTPELNLNLQGTVLYDSVYKVGPGRYTSLSVSLPNVCTIQGGFIASAGLGDNIIVYVLDEQAYGLYQRGDTVSTYYNSGKVEFGTFDLTLNPGDYYVILSNTYSSFSTKNVQLQVSGFC